jgi:hypothetical protein
MTRRGSHAPRVARHASRPAKSRLPSTPLVPAHPTLPRTPTPALGWTCWTDLDWFCATGLDIVGPCSTHPRTPSPAPGPGGPNPPGCRPAPQPATPLGPVAPTRRRPPVPHAEPDPRSPIGPSRAIAVESQCLRFGRRKYLSHRSVFAQMTFLISVFAFFFPFWGRFVQF